VGGQRTDVMIPEGATVEVVHGSYVDARKVDVLWQGRTLAVFAEDFFERANRGEVRFSLATVVIQFVICARNPSQNCRPRPGTPAA
jgi:hypothetical protein